MLGMKRPPSTSKSSEDVPVEKRSRSVSDEPSLLEKKVLCDRFCWRCHKEGTLLECKVCPRSFHPRCDPQGSAQDSQWTCFECRRIMAAEDIDTRSPAMALLSVEQLRTLLKYALLRLKQSALIVFHNPVSIEEYPKYPEYIVHPMDLSLLEKNIRDRVYGSTEAFLADVKWILHNSIIFNGDGHRLTAAAKSVVNAAKQEMKEIEICPDCYLHAHTMKEKWFIEPCRRSHVLVWAKMKGYPYWPGKALRIVNGNVDVRFFGAHDRAQVPLQLVFLLSYDMPQPLKSKKKAKFYVALEELDQHLQKLRAKLGGFEYAPLRTPLNVDHLYLQPISKVTTGRRHSDAEQSAQPKGRTVTIVTSSWMRKLQAEGHVKPSGKEKKEKTAASVTTTDVPKMPPASRMQGPPPQSPDSSPNKNISVKSELKRRNSSERVNLPAGVFEISDRSLDIPPKLDINLNVAELPDMERHREFQSTLDKLQERILETCRDDSQEEDSSAEMEDSVQERKTPSPPVSNTNNDVQMNVEEETVAKTEENPVSCDIPTNGGQFEDQLVSNTEEWLNSKKSCAFSQRLGQTIESCKAKLGIQDIEIEPNTGKTSESDDETGEESISSECEKETKDDKMECEKDVADKLCVVSDVSTKTESEVKSLQDDVITNVEIAEDVVAGADTARVLNEDFEMNQEVTTGTVVEVEDPEKSNESHEISSADELVINEEKQVDVAVTHVSEDSRSERLPNGIDHFESTNSGTGTFKESIEEPAGKNGSDQQSTPEPENCTMPQLDISTESDIANYAHKLIDFMKELGRDGGSNPQATIRSLELELEKQRWHHQQELVEIKHNTDLVLLEVRASLEIDKEKALSELKRKHYIEKSRAIEEMKRKFNEERNKLEQERNLQTQEIKRKQWCAHCQKEAIYYCCWNTSYCDYPCQQAHWMSHQESCGQLQGNNLVDIPQNKNITLNKSALLVNSPQVAKSPAVQVQYMPTQTPCYRIMAPNVTMTPPTLPRISQPTPNIVTVQAVSRSSAMNTTSVVTPLSKTYGKSQ